MKNNFIDETFFENIFLDFENGVNRKLAKAFCGRNVFFIYEQLTTMFAGQIGFC